MCNNKLYNGEIMTNEEILRAYLWHIGLYAHSPSDQAIHDELVGNARRFVGLDIRVIREGLQIEDILVLILYDINGQIYRCDWYAADKNFGLFDQIASNKRVMGSLLFDRWYKASVVYYRRGLFDKAISCTLQAEQYAVGHKMKLTILMQRGEIECSMKNRYEFSVNSLSAALYEAEQLGDIYVVRVYDRLAHMCSLRYAALGMYYLRKAQVIAERLGDTTIILENKMARVNSYSVLTMRHPQDEKLFLDEAKSILATIDYEKLPMLQNKMYYKELQGKIYFDVDPLIEACNFYESVNSIDEVCRMCDAIIEIGVNHNQALKAKPYIDLYRRMVIKRNRNDVSLVLNHINQAEEIINGILARQAK